MFALLIETATERGIVSILNGKQLLFHRELPFGINSSKFMLPAINEGLNLLNLEAKDLSHITVGIGPGSYTGIRVAAATAQSMAYAMNIPLVGISTLACFAPPADGQFTVLIDAKIGGVYLLNATKQSGVVKADSEPAVVPLDNLREALGKGRIAVTPNGSVLKLKLEAIYGDLGLEWIECPPDPRLMGAISSEKLLKGESSKNGKLELLYLRKTQAEMNKENL